MGISSWDDLLEVMTSVSPRDDDSAIYLGVLKTQKIRLANAIMVLTPYDDQEVIIMSNNTNAVCLTLNGITPLIYVSFGIPISDEMRKSSIKASVLREKMIMLNRMLDL